MSQETEVKLTLNEYQKAAITTAVYDKKYHTVYPVLGLVEEVGELLSADLEDVDNFVSECGDVMWYSASLATDCGMKLQDCYDNATLSTLPDGQALFTNAATIAGRVKKIIRGDTPEDNSAKFAVIEGCIGDIIRRLQSLAVQFQIPLEEVCERNLDKLFDRKERGVLKGDGDNR